MFEGRPHPPITGVRFPVREDLITDVSPGWPNSTEADNIMFGTILKAAPWHSSPLNTWLCWFGKHTGLYIRVASAPSPWGPWAIHTAGTDVNPTTFEAAGGWTGTGHIASPDVLPDDVNARYVMAFHALATGFGHSTTFAVSDDGVAWTYPTNAAVNSSETYLRRFQVGPDWYGIGNRCELQSSPDADGITGWVSRADQGAWRDVAREGLDIRHSGVRLDGDDLHVYFTRIGDNPERVMRATADVSGAFSGWALGPPEEIIAPMKRFEGTGAAAGPSGGGNAGPNPLRQLRDPYPFTLDDGTRALLYAAAGENSLAMALLEP